MRRSNLSMALLTGTLAFAANAAWAAGAPSAAAEGSAVPFVLQLGLLFAVARAGGLLAERLHVPPVLGEVAAGLLAGPHLLGGIRLPGFPEGLMSRADTALAQGGDLQIVATLSLMVLLFLLGLETDVRRVRRNYVTGTLVGLGGTLVTAGLVGALVWLAGPRLLGLQPAAAATAAAFAGVAAAASSVGIAARVLARQRHLETPEGVAVMAAAVVDNLAGVVLLALAFGWAHVRQAGAPAGMGLFHTLLRTALSGAALIGICLLFSRRALRDSATRRAPAEPATLALAAALVAGGLLGRLGLAPLAAAYAVGLALATTDLRHVIQEQLGFLHAAFIPACFALLGMQIDPALLQSPGVLLFMVLFLLTSMVAKLAGCGLPALLAGFTGAGSLRIGAGMVPRGEAAMAFAAAGLIVGGLPPVLFLCLAVLLFVSALTAPQLAAAAFRHTSTGVRHPVPRREESRIVFRFPSHDAASLIVSRLIEVLENEGFFIHLLNRRDSLYQVSHENIVASLRRTGADVLVDCATQDRSFFDSAMIEVLAGLERSLRELRRPLDAAEIQRRAQAEHGTQLTPNSLLRDTLAVECLRPRLLSDDKAGIITELLDLLDEQGLLRDAASARQAVLDREEGFSTGLEHGLAIPHGRTDAVDRLVCAIGLKQEGADFGSMDSRPTRIVILVLAPACAAAPQLQFISQICQVLNEQGRAALLACDTAEDMHAVLTSAPRSGEAGRRGVRGPSALDCLQWHNIGLDLQAHTKDELIDQLLGLCVRSGAVTDLATVRQAVLGRERRMSTGMENGVALPHARTEAVDRMVCAVGISRAGIDFGAVDGQPSRIFAMVLMPPSVTTEYTQLTGLLMRALDAEGRQAILAAKSSQEVRTILARGERRASTRPPA